MYPTNYMNPMNNQPMSPDYGYNRWDLYYVMNMLYSDYYNVLGSDTAIYVKLSKAWFEDPDVSEGKAYRYYMQVAKA